MAEDQQRIGARSGKVKGGAGNSQNVPFGLANAPYAFTRLVSELTKDGTRRPRRMLEHSSKCK